MSMLQLHCNTKWKYTSWVDPLCDLRKEETYCLQRCPKSEIESVYSSTWG